MSKVLGFLGLFVLIVATLGSPPLQEERQRGSPVAGRRKSDTPSEIFEIEPRFRLNDTIIPSHYEVELLVILENDPDVGTQFTAPSKVTIDFKPAGDTSNITLHANLITVDLAAVKFTSDARPSEVISVTGTTNDTISDRHFLTMELDTPLKEGEGYKIYLESVAPISRDRLNGLYLSTYVDAAGELKRLAATQMESYHLRQLFPCFDEPDLKATFDVKVIRRSNYTALHNSNLLSTVNDTRQGFQNYQIDTFNTTVPMSTYIFALVVSDFEYAQANSSLAGGKPVRVYAQPELIQRGDGDYSAEVSAQLLQFLNDYFAADYPMPKMDSVAVPDFSAGAMENYGLNLYRLSLLMYNQDETLETARYSITNVLAHELGHQNFGNLVTCKWWTNIWLNEGFATYVSYIAAQGVRPEFRFLEDQLNDAFQYSMVVDASDESHPMLNDALTPDQIDQYFSGITYEKGGSVIRMTEKFLTEHTMKKGLQYYLQDMKYQGSEQDDLFRNLQKAATEDNRLPAGVTVKEILDSWTLKRRFPLVRVSTLNANSVNISQEVFKNSDTVEVTSELWYVPVTVVTQDKPTLVNNVPELWLPKTQAFTTFAHHTSKWIMVNQDATGYYRVLYDAPLTALIKSQLETNPSAISPLSRSQLLDDYFTLAFQKYINIETALDLTTYLEQEDHFTVWDVVFTQLRKTNYLLGSSPTFFASFRNYLLPRVESALLKVGLNQSPNHIGAAAIYRAAVLDWACSLEHPACFSQADKFLADWIANPAVNPVNKDVQSTLYCAMVASGGKAAGDFILQKYLEQPAGSALKTRLLNALACSSDSMILLDLIAGFVEGSSTIPLSDATALIQRVAMNPQGREAVMLLLTDNVTEIISLIGGGQPGPVGSIVSTLSAYLSTQAGLDALTKFIDDNSAALTPINGTLQTSLNNVRSNIKWVADFGNAISNWLTSNEPPTDATSPATTPTGTGSTDPNENSSTTTNPDDSGAGHQGTSTFILALASIVFFIRF